MAIIADWLDKYAGAERCVKSFIKVFNTADIYSLVDFLSPEEKKLIVGNKNIITSFLQNIPFAKKHFRKMLFLFPYAIESFDLRKYDVILSSSHSVAKNVLTTSEQIHVCYCHTPMRYAWDMYFDYMEKLNGLEKMLFKLLMHKIRIWDFASVGRVDYFIANSNFVKRRIKKIYSRDAAVIYPPVDINLFDFEKTKENYFVTVSRLVGYKRVDLLVKAFNRLGEKLIIIGEGEEKEKLMKMAGDNIIFKGYVSHKEKVNILKRAKAFVYAAKEDFGIAPVEAQVCGTPVIALNKGGTAESVIDGVSGILFNEQNEENIIKAVNDFNKRTFDYFAIREHSMKFDVNKFEEKIKSFLESII